MKLSDHNYGKARVRVMKVTRGTEGHSLKELEVSILLRGDFDASYTRGDNRLVVATDTMKNTVNALAREKLGAEIEEFGIALGQHFLAAFRQVENARVRVMERRWERLNIDGRAHPHSFRGAGPERAFAEIVCARGETAVTSGVEDLLILKTTESGFEGFARDKYTTLKETKDRILATQLRAEWRYERAPANYAARNNAILDAMLRVFATTYSPSAQTTLFQMGEAALATAPEISKVSLTMPNKHCLLIDLSPFGLENRNEIFVPTDEPHGQIEGTMTRD